jgi:mRNA-degrading endonuclease RelE of RelBE toxin-antitoxin system
VSDDQLAYGLRVTGPAQRQLDRLPEGTAAAIVEFMIGALLENPYRVGGPLQRELAGLRSARRGAYRIVYEIIEPTQLVIVHRIDHRVNVYRPR